MVMDALVSIAFAAEEVVKKDDVRTLFDTITSLPKLGTTGIVLFLVAIVVAIGLWWWWNSYAKKITHRKNEKQRVKDQATNKTENQEISDELNEAHEKVEDLRKDGEEGTKPRPKPPTV